VGWDEPLKLGVTSLDKLARQRELVKRIATEPWIHTYSNLAKLLGVTQITVQRDFEEMKDNGFQFQRNEQGTLYLQVSGWNGVMPVKASTLRQMEILRILTSTPQGLTLTGLYKRFNRRDAEEVSGKTLERAMKDLEKKNLISEAGKSMWFARNTSYPLFS